MTNKREDEILELLLLGEFPQEKNLKIQRWFTKKVTLSKLYIDQQFSQANIEYSQKIVGCLKSTLFFSLIPVCQFC